MSRDNKFFLGLDEVSCQVNSGCDKGLKDKNIAHFVRAFNCKTVRVWLSTKEIIRIKEDDKIEFVAEGLIRLHNYLETMRRAGVERFLLLDWAFVYPYGYVASDRNVVPDPKREPEMYKRFILLQQKVRYEIASNFSFIEYFESTNEPEGIGGNFFHKNGYHPDAKNLEDYVFTREEVEDIILDLNYYESLGVKAANKNAKMLLPSFCNLEYAPNYLDDIYKKIESGKYPTFGETKSNKIDDFFDILNWHPYNMISVQINEDWIRTQQNIRKVILKHHDGNRRVWYTENGWSDFQRENEKIDIAKRYIDLFTTVKDKLPWVETVFIFRLFTLANRPECEGEDNFGVVYNEFDWFTPLLPKPAAVAIYKYANGEDAPLDALYKLCTHKDRDLFPNINIKSGKKTYNVLILGNHIAYQKKAEWNNYLESKGMDASKIENDFPHILFNKLKDKYHEVDMTVVDMRVWEKCFYYQPIFDELQKFNKDYDLVVVRLGDNVGPNSFKDHVYKNYLLKLCKQFAGKNTKFVITSTFEAYKDVDSHQQEVAKILDCPYINLQDIRMNYEYISKNKYLNNEYKNYPNDLGMEKIADLIYKKIN